jgi:hypothetical protein
MAKSQVSNTQRWNFKQSVFKWNNNNVIPTIVSVKICIPRIYLKTVLVNVQQYICINALFGVKSGVYRQQNISFVKICFLYVQWVWQYNNRMVSRDRVHVKMILMGNPRFGAWSGCSLCFNKTSSTDFEGSARQIYGSILLQRV